jgi:hypothetical protein
MILINTMDYLNGYLNEYLESILLTVPSIFIFLSGYYINKTQYQKNNIILENIEKIKLDVDDVKSRDHKKLKNEIKKLKEENEKFLNKIEELSLIIIDKNKKITEHDKKIEEYYGLKIKIRDLEKKTQEEKIENPGNGVLRYKNKEGTMFYHGMGHLENKYSWWEPYMSRKFCEYKNVDKKLKFPLFETHNVNDFCSNNEYCVEINKNKRVMFYYECKGHKINVD